MLTYAAMTPPQVRVFHVVLLCFHIITGKVSSQYISSVLLAAPFAKEPLELILAETKPTSISYILMTVKNMKQFGIDVEVIAPNHYRIPVGKSPLRCI